MKDLIQKQAYDDETNEWRKLDQTGEFVEHTPNLDFLDVL